MPSTTRHKGAAGRLGVGPNTTKTMKTTGGIHCAQIKAKQLAAISTSLPDFWWRFTTQWTEFSSSAVGNTKPFSCAVGFFKFYFLFSAAVSVALICYLFWFFFFCKHDLYEQVFVIMHRPGFHSVCPESVCC